jgi:outer membrane protein OmpA-like peptidoglycan-associated protein/tetratricopeptide (TPR) repeat protein
MKLSTIKHVMILILVLMLAMNMQPLQGQSDEYRKELNAVLKKAAMAYQDYKFSIAADYYESYLSEATYDTEEPLRKLADCYWHMRVYNEALRVYNLLYPTEDAIGSTNHEERYRIAELYARFGQYEKAWKWLAAVDGYQSKAATYKSYEKLDLMKEDSLSWKINLLNINTTYREFSPFLVGDMLFFCSNKLLPFSEKTFDWDGNNFTHLWKVPVSEIESVPELTSKDSTSTEELKQNNIKLAGVYPLGDRSLNQNALRSTIRQYYSAANRNTIGSLINGLNDRPFNVGAMTMDAYNHVYFSSNYSKYTAGINRIGLMEGIYSSTRGILKTHALALGDPKTYSVMHPAVDQEGTIIVFSSDKPGGRGGLDLYYAQRENNNSSWGNIQTFKGNINTVGNEVFPSISPKGDLYFSSDALPGLGGLDIYRINLQDALIGKGEPEHLSSPVNSSADDFGLTQSRNGLKGYFTSDRLNCDDNIYSFSFEAQKRISKLLIQGIVKDEISNKPIRNATLFLLTKKDNKVFVSKSNENGKYSFVVTTSGDIVIKGIEKEHSANCLSIRVNPKKAPLNDSVITSDLLLGRLKLGAKWRLGNIVYDKSNFNIRPIDRPVLDSLLRILNQYPIKVEIGVHTDSRGTAAENERESQHSANSAIFYLLDHGIDPDRIVSKGYGESELINRCADGVPCTEEEHQANRRTEVKIIGFTIAVRDFKVDPDKFNAGDRADKALFPNGFFDTCK